MTVIVSCLPWNKTMFSTIFLISWISISSPWCLYSLWRDGSIYSKVRPVLGQCPWLSVPPPLLYSYSSIHPSYLPCHSSHHQPCSLTVILTLKAGGECKWVSLHQPFITMFCWVWGCITSSLKCFPFLLSSLHLFSPELLWRLKLSLLPSATHTSMCVALSNSDWVAVAFVILGSRPLEIILLLCVQGGLG